MPFLGLCQFASISIQKMVLTDLERGQQGEWDSLLVWNKKHNTKRTTGPRRWAFVRRAIYCRVCRSVKSRVCWFRRWSRRIWKEGNKESEIHYWFETKNTISNAPPGCKVKLLSCRQFKEIHPKQQRQTKSKQGHNEPMRTHSNHNANIKISTIKSTNHTNMQWITTIKSTNQSMKRRCTCGASKCTNQIRSVQN
jgi:hypothetical protein